MIYPPFEKVKSLARRYNRIPVYREMDFSEVGLLSLVKALHERGNVLFFESARENKTWSRFSFIGLEPVRTLRFLGAETVEQSPDGIARHEGDFFRLLRAEMGRYRSPAYARFGPFSGGLCGYLGYGMANYAGILRRPVRERCDEPLAELAQVDEFIVHDNKTGRYHIATCMYPGREGSIAGRYDAALNRLGELESGVLEAIRRATVPYLPARPSPVTLRYVEDDESATASIGTIRQLIADGEAIQAVYSMRADIEGRVDPYRFYLKLRSVNPSPYMFFLKTGSLCIAGSSPETHVRVEGRRVIIKPIAGTVPQGSNRREREALKAALLADVKERAEHLMLVDLARNDIGRISAPGSVSVDRFMTPEEFSHVIHLVSVVSGTLAEGKDMVDALRETFPAGTVSGAPKVRAMEMIDELEAVGRGVYAGAIGYLGYNGRCDTCIAIRTAVFNEEGGYLQAGAGIVYDSVPEREIAEMRYKLRALAASLEYALITEGEVRHVSHDR